MMDPVLVLTPTQQAQYLGRREPIKPVSQKLATPVDHGLATQHVPISRGLAATILKDFSRAAVDEDLEMLRSQWFKPASQELAEDPSRVCGRALDYQSSARLATIAALRRIATLEAADASGHGEAGIIAVYRGCHERTKATASWLPDRTDVELAVRESGDDASDAGLDWRAWEERWAEELRGFASAPASQPPPSYHRRRSGRSTPPRSPSRSRESEASERAGKPHSRAKAHPRSRASHGRGRRAATPPPRSPPPRSPPPPPSPPTRAAKPPPAAPKTRYASFEEFDVAFARFEENLANVPRGVPVVALSDIPLPPCSDPAGVSGIRGLPSAAGECKKRLRKALLRWHPDKWSAVLDRVRDEDKAALGEKLRAITQALIREKDRC